MHLWNQSPSVSQSSGPQTEQLISRENSSVPKTASDYNVHRHYFSFWWNILKWKKVNLPVSFSMCQLFLLQLLLPDFLHRQRHALYNVSPLSLHQWPVPEPNRNMVADVVYTEWDQEEKNDTRFHLFLYWP